MPSPRRALRPRRESRVDERRRRYVSSPPARDLVNSVSDGPGEWHAAQDNPRSEQLPDPSMGGDVYPLPTQTAAKTRCPCFFCRVRLKSKV